MCNCFVHIPTNVADSMLLPVDNCKSFSKVDQDPGGTDDND